MTKGFSMEMHGSIDALKKAIKAEYARKARDIAKASRLKIKEINSAFLRQRKLLKEQLSNNLALEVSALRASLLNEQKLLAKRQFEEERERMIDEVLSEARKSFPVFMKSNAYLSFLKKNIPENASVFGNPYFKKHFPEMKEDKNLNGVIFRKGSYVCDLTLDSLFEAKRHKVRAKAIEVLWGDKA